ncbi:MAG: Gfo/Idh/MocA family oxidoreductase [Candidatus Hydrogenedentes bacterium]|nr:Gfo/Idh/MocA family oxidoreductase [Candidatus Hydrogenedentota bacterium]
MPNSDPVKVGIIGSGFEADIHAHSMRMLHGEVDIVAVASPSPGHADAFAGQHNIPRAFTSYADLLALPEIQMVTIAAPNYLHAQIVADAARAGKHIVCEKPLCMTLEEADAMIDVC